LADCAGAFFFGWLGWKSTVGLLKNSLMLFERKAQLGFASRQGGRKGARLVYYSSFSGDTHRVPRVWARRPSAGRGEAGNVQRGGDGGTGAGSPHAPSLALAERAASTIPDKGSCQPARVVSSDGDSMARICQTICASHAGATPHPLRGSSPLRRGASAWQTAGSPSDSRSAPAGLKNHTDCAIIFLSILPSWNQNHI